jgi:signal transduction histidine kinase
MVQGSARHLLALINDVLDISKIEAGQLAVQREPFDLRGSIEKVVEAMRPLAERNGLTLRHQIALESDLLVSDQRRVEQVLTNLLGNSIKFTEQGEVCLTCVSCGDWVTVCVRDTGIGIQEEHLGEIFKPFLQIDSGVTRKHEGTGLGLSICQRLVELLGGTICVESQYGVGSTFTFTLPATSGGSI